jgi:hypothetical protein
MIGAGFGICLLVLWIWLSPGCRAERAFYHIEEDAKKVITGTELQTWATNLLMQYPTNVWLSPKDLGTNFPKRMQKLITEVGPTIRIEQGETNFPPSVVLVWGSGMLGGAGFEIGPTNFMSIRGGHAWQPGVYFWRQ